MGSDGTWHFSFLAHLRKCHAPSRELAEAMERYAALDVSELDVALPPLYLLWEHNAIAAGDPLDRVRVRVADTLRTEFPALLENMDFGLIFDRRRPQERQLCQLFLIDVVGEAAATWEGAAAGPLAQLHDWLTRVPNVGLPVPRELRNSIPAHNSEWIALFIRLARALHLEWEERVGDAGSCSIFEHAYDRLLRRYGLLESSPSVVNLLPPSLLDSEKLSKLSRSQIQQVLHSTLTDLGSINISLGEKNRKLGEMQQHLVAAQVGLELRVAERTTELLQVNEELRAAKERAEVAHRAKSEFLAHMSHELRTPLNAVMGFSEIIRDAILGPVDERYRSYAGHIHASGQHLLEIINDILDLTKLESGKFELHEEPVELKAIVQSCCEMVQGRARKEGVRLTVVLAPDLPLVFADPLRLKQIGINLMTNAVKFTPNGGKVTIAVRRDQGGEILLEVSDTGIGMRPEDVAVAMEPFRQIASQLNRGAEGTGLGLPLVKRLTELHNGQLEIVSALGVGTTVTVRLPAERVMPAQALSAS